MESFKLKPTPTKLKHLNTRKEGQEDDLTLAIDAKFSVEGHFDLLGTLFPDSEIFEAHKAALFDKDGNIRCQGLSGISFGGCSLSNHDLSVSVLGKNMDFRNVKLHKFEAKIDEGFKTELIFTATLKPTAREVASLADALLEYVTLSVMPPPMLFDKEEKNAEQALKKNIAAMLPDRDGLDSVTITAGDNPPVTITKADANRMRKELKEETK